MYYFVVYPHCSNNFHNAYKPLMFTSIHHFSVFESWPMISSQSFYHCRLYSFECPTLSGIYIECHYMFWCISLYPYFISFLGKYSHRIRLPLNLILLQSLAWMKTVHKIYSSFTQKRLKFIKWHSWGFPLWGITQFWFRCKLPAEPVDRHQLTNKRVI